MKLLRLSIPGLLAVAAPALFAHPGHGGGIGHSADLLHPLFGVGQVLLLAAVAGLFVLRQKGLWARKSDHEISDHETGE